MKCFNCNTMITKRHAKKNDDHDIPSLEEPHSILQKKDKLKISVKELVDVQINTCDQENMIKGGVTLATWYALGAKLKENINKPDANNGLKGNSRAN